MASITALLFWKRMAEICTSPFDANFWDWGTKKAIEAQIYIASLALYNARDVQKDQQDQQNQDQNPDASVLTMPINGSQDQSDV